MNTITSYHGTQTRLQAIAEWIGSQEHPTDCLCISCAPISTPTRSPSVDDALAGKHGSDVAQGTALLASLKPYGRKVAMRHLRALIGLQGQL